MNIEQNVTKHIKAQNQNMQVLKKYFGQCFDKDGNFDIEKFKQMLSENEINFYKEGYGLDWLGKSYARLLASDEATTLLKEDEAHNQQAQNKDSQNVLIKGDNLEVLKHLSNAYYEKVKMIYIDPPYNTGSDGFVYADDRKFTVKELQELVGIDEDKAKRILEFTQSKSNSHSAWLTFMYPRLYIAKQLLKEDGVIFISIDDNEQANLKLLCDEIFGEENFINNFLWLHGKGKKDNHSRTLQQYVLCYAKEVNKLDSWTTCISKNYASHNGDNDERGEWFSGSISFKEGRSNKAHKNYFKITSPSGKVWERQWQCTYEEMEEYLSENRIYFGAAPRYDAVPRLKIFPTNEEIIPKNILDEVGTTRSAQKELDATLTYAGIGKEFNPKSTCLIKHIIKMCMNDNDLILDFFAGSGTTGDAIMQLNVEDGGSRNYILVQLPEVIDKEKSKTAYSDKEKSRTAYSFVKDELHVESPTIFEITKERLLRSAKKIQADNKQAKEQKELTEQDFGFKIFETTPIWEDYNFESDILDDETTLFDETTLTKDDLKLLLITWKTYDGSALTEKYESYDLGGYTGYYVNGKLYLMHTGFSTANLKNLLEKIDADKMFNPRSIIAFGYHFESKHLREIAENIKSYANKKSIDIEFITRY